MTVYLLRRVGRRTVVHMKGRPMRARCGARADFDGAWRESAVYSKAQTTQCRRCFPDSRGRH